MKYSYFTPVVCSQEMLTEGGLLIIASPYTWKQEHTNIEHWIGGYLKDAENHFTG